MEKVNSNIGILLSLQNTAFFSIWGSIEGGPRLIQNCVALTGDSLPENDIFEEVFGFLNSKLHEQAVFNGPTLNLRRHGLTSLGVCAALRVCGCRMVGHGTDMARLPGALFRQVG